jgi:excisionase family DNA binding protein
MTASYQAIRRTATGEAGVDEAFLSIREVAAHMNVHYQTIWAMVRRGEIESIRIGSAIRIPESALSRLAAGNREAGDR